MEVIIKERINQIKQGIVPKGYKRTNVGIVPNDWKENTFKNLFSFEGGLGIPRDQLGELGMPYLHYGDIHINDFLSVSVEQYKKEPKYNIDIKGSEKYLLQDGDIVFLDASEDLFGTSRCVLINNKNKEPFISGLHTIIAKDKSKELANDFKQYITQPYEVKKQFAKYANGFKVYGLNRQTFKKITICYPNNISEQENIANILMLFDKNIKIQKQKVNALENQRKAVCQKLLKPTNDWNKIQLKDVIIEKKKKNNCSNEKVLSVSNKKGFILQSEQFTKEVASEDTSNYKIVEKNNIAYNPSRINVGSIALYEEDDPGIVSPMYVVLEAKKCDAKFLLYQLDADYGKYLINSYLCGSVRDTLNYKNLSEIKIQMPKIEIQKEISEKIKNFDKLIKLEGQKIGLLELQRKALMQLLLSGIVRC